MSKDKRLNRENAVYTPDSSATIMINYSVADKVLEVEFINSGVYHYLNVPREIWREYKTVIISGNSSGNFVNTQVKPYYGKKKLKL